MVSGLPENLADVEASSMINPFMMAVKYCDCFVNDHPFKDAYGRMCRLILNTILVKHAEIAVSLGEKSEDRAEYLQIAQESPKVGGHSGQSGTLVLSKAGGASTKMLKTLKC